MASDVFSYAVVLWELLTFHLPWGPANPWQVGGSAGGRVVEAHGAMQGVARPAAAPPVDAAALLPRRLAGLPGLASLRPSLPHLSPLDTQLALHCPRLLPLPPLPPPLARRCS